MADKKVCVTGGAGFLGRRVCANLMERGVGRLSVPRSADYDLTDAADVVRLFDDCKPELIIHLAAEVGGIGANARHPGRFFYANMAMGLHLIEEARRRGVAKFVQVGSVCSYPKHCPTPFREADLWNGYPEETNAPYGVAKRALGVMLDAYRREYGLGGVYLVPVNLYGPHDNFDLQTSHVIPAIIERLCTAVADFSDTVTCWGTGHATREFLYVDDAAEAIVTAAEEHNDPDPINLGSGEEVSMRQLAELIADLTGFQGQIQWDDTRPDGQPRRHLDSSRAAKLLGWTAKTSLRDGLIRTIQWHCADRSSRLSLSPKVDRISR